MTLTEPALSRQVVAAALAGHTPPRLLLGELVLELDLVRAALGLAADAAVPLAAEQALLRRWGHDAVVVPFSHGWGAPTQPEPEDALFRLGYWQEESDLFVCALVDGPFSAAVKAWGWQNALIHLTRGHPDLEAFMADAVVELSEQLGRVAAAGADGVIIGEDLALRNGPTVRPDHLRQRYFPYLTLLTLAAQDLGLPVFFHSDGNLWPIWQDLLQCGIDGVQGLDPYSAMSLAQARARSGPRLCLWGNLDLGWLAQPRSGEEIAARLHDLIDPVAGAPLIFGFCGGLAPGLSLPQLDLLYAAAAAFPWPAPADRVLAPSAGF